MSMMAMAFPVLPGKVEAGKRFAEEVQGPRRAEFEDKESRLGVRQEHWFLQAGEQGDLVLVVWESDEPLGSLTNWADATTDFERWFIGRVEDICGVDLRQTPPAEAIPENILAWQAQR